MSLLTIMLFGTAVVLVFILLLAEWNRQDKKKPIPLHFHANEAIRKNNAIPLQPQASELQEQTTEIKSEKTTVISESNSVPLLYARFKAVEQKTQMAHERIQRIEKIVSRIPLEQLEKGLDISELEKKVERLVIFKNDIRIQVAALEEEIEKEKKSKPVVKSKQLDALEKELKEQDKSLQEIEARIIQKPFNKRKRN